jgi:integrase
MRWSEVDFDKKIWTVPAARMKAAREHRVPLSPRAVVILRKLEKLKRAAVRMHISSASAEAASRSRSLAMKAALFQSPCHLFSSCLQPNSTRRRTISGRAAWIAGLLGDR